MFIHGCAALSQMLRFFVLKDDCFEADCRAWTWSSAIWFGFTLTPIVRVGHQQGLLRFPVNSFVDGEDDAEEPIALALSFEDLLRLEVHLVTRRSSIGPRGGDSKQQRLPARRHAGAGPLDQPVCLVLVILVSGDDVRRRTVGRLALQLFECCVLLLDHQAVCVDPDTERRSQIRRRQSHRPGCIENFGCLILRGCAGEDLRAILAICAEPVQSHRGRAWRLPVLSRYLDVGVVETPESLFLIDPAEDRAVDEALPVFQLELLAMRRVPFEVVLYVRQRFVEPDEPFRPGLVIVPAELFALTLAQIVAVALAGQLHPFAGQLLAAENRLYVSRRACDA
jgi:hypothetical protein